MTMKKIIEAVAQGISTAVMFGSVAIVAWGVESVFEYFGLPSLNMFN